LKLADQQGAREIGTHKIAALEGRFGEVHVGERQRRCHIGDGVEPLVAPVEPRRVRRHAEIRRPVARCILLVDHLERITPKSLARFQLGARSLALAVCHPVAPACPPQLRLVRRELRHATSRVEEQAIRGVERRDVAFLEIGMGGARIAAGRRRHPWRGPQRDGGDDQQDDRNRRQNQLQAHRPTLAAGHSPR